MSWADAPTFSYVSLPGMKEENILFNDTLSTFYLRLYDIRPQIMRKRTTHTTAFVTPVVKHWLEIDPLWG